MEDQLPRQALQRPGLDVALQQAGELVAAPAAHHVLGPQRPRQPGGDDAQPVVAHRMAMPVVDLPETVEVEDEHRQR